MTKEEEAITREEAIRRIKAWNLDLDDMEVLSVVIPELAESEDERIRKELVLFLSDIKRISESGRTTWAVRKEDAMLCNAALAYLEKQKEQKPFPKFRIGDRMRTKQEALEGITDGMPVIISMDDTYYYCTNEKIPIAEQDEYEYPTVNIELKPVEWSEEDEKMMKDIDLALRKLYDASTRLRIETRLKSLRPQPHTVSIKDATKFGNLEYERGVKDGIQSEKSRHWKPSEEQMKAFKMYIQEFQARAEAAVGGWNNFDVMVRLYEQLKKLDEIEIL